MPTTLPPAAQAVIVFELALLLAGLVLLWRLVASPAARARRLPSRLPIWEVSIPDFLTFIFFVIVGGIVAQIGAVQGMNYFPLLESDTRMIVAGGAFQGGMLAGCLAYWGLHGGATFSAPAVPAPNQPWRSPVVAGAIAFVIAMPLVTAAGIVWNGLLTLLGVEAEKQELIDLFANADSPALIAALVLLGVVVAPVTEELIFRGGIFRFARGRLPRWAAYLLPALLFAAVHGNLSSIVPLLTLGLIFAFAYERTGHITVPIVAHGLFNLNTIVLIFSGISP